MSLIANLEQLLRSQTYPWLVCEVEDRLQIGTLHANFIEPGCGGNDEDFIFGQAVFQWKSLGELGNFLVEHALRVLWAVIGKMGIDPLFPETRNRLNDCSQAVL